MHTATSLEIFQQRDQQCRDKDEQQGHADVENVHLPLRSESMLALITVGP